MDAADHYLKAELYGLVRTDPSVFEFLQDGSLDGIWYWDLENPENEWMSPSFWKTLGHDPSGKEHLASEWQDLIDPDDLQLSLENLQLHCADPDHPYDQVVRYLNRDGSTVWVRCRGMAIRDASGKPVRMLGAHTDLTSLKRAEEDLRRNEEFMERIFDSMSDGFCVLDPELRVIRLNRTMADWFSDGSPVEGKFCYSAFLGREEECEECPAARALASHEPEIGDMEIELAEGVPGTFELSAYPLFGEGGEVTGVVEITRDVTALRASEAVLARREELYRSLFENNSSVMLLVDPEDGAIRDANPRACSFYGYSREAMLGMTVADLNTLSSEEVQKEIARALAEERNLFNFQHQLSDGTTRDVEVFTGPIKVKGRSLLCSVVHDVSERKAAEHERESLILELQTALSEVRTLRGFIPICAACKKIRDDHGYWKQLEVYISERSEAEFSHGICPECVEKMYPDIDLETD